MDSEPKSYFKVGNIVNYADTSGSIKEIKGDKAYLEWGTDVFERDWGEGWIPLEVLLLTNPNKMILQPTPYSAPNWIPVEKEENE